MIITGLEVRACQLEPCAMAVNILRAVEVDQAMEFLACTVTSEMNRASMFGFPARSARGATLTGQASVALVKVGQNVPGRERIWYEMRRADRM